MSLLRIEVEPAPVGEVLAIDGVAAWGDALPRMLARLRAADDESLARLRGVRGDDVLVLVGPSDALPWIDGARYLARTVDEPNLLLPTGVRTQMSPRIVLRALLGKTPGLRPPLVLLPDGRRLISIADARPIVRAQLGSDRG